MVTNPLKGNWKITRMTGVAMEVLASNTAAWPSIDLSHTNSVTTVGDFNWKTTDHGSPGGHVVCGQITGPDPHTPLYGFAIYRWKPDGPKKRLKGLVYKLTTSVGDDTEDPGTWEAEEGGNPPDPPDPREC